MRRSFPALIIAVFALLSSLQLPAHAQQSRPFSAMRSARYQKATEVTTSGTVQSIQAESNSGLPKATYLVLQAPPLTLTVNLGMLSVANAPFKVGDQIQATGSLVTINGQQILLARQIQSAGQTLTLRSQSGLVVRPSMGTATEGGQQ